MSRRDKRGFVSVRIPNVNIAANNLTKIDFRSFSIRGSRTKSGKNDDIKTAGCRDPDESVVIGKDEWLYSKIAGSLWISPSEVHAGVKRVIKARLAFVQQDRVFPNARNVGEFILHGVPYFFVPELHFSQSYSLGQNRTRRQIKCAN